MTHNGAQRSPGGLVPAVHLPSACKPFRDASRPCDRGTSSPLCGTTRIQRRRSGSSPFRGDRPGAVRYSTSQSACAYYSPMTEVVIARVVQADGVFGLRLGVRLLLSGSDRLFRAFHLPQGKPPLLGQRARAALIAFLYLLRIVPRAAERIRYVTAGVAVARLIPIALILLGLAGIGPDALGVGLAGIGLLIPSAVMLAVSAVRERDAQFDEA